MLPGVAFSGEPSSKTCTYQVYNWNIHSKGPVNQARVTHPYAELKPEEKGPRHRLHRLSGGSGDGEGRQYRILRLPEDRARS